MKALVPIITRVGMRAVFRADSEGLQARISHIAFGSSLYVPTGEETALKNERVRIPISGGSWRGDFLIHMVGLLDTGPTFWVGEVGLILSDGTMLAVWSDPATPLFEKSENVSIAVAFDLTLEALPKSAVTVQAGNVDLNLFFGSEFARLSAAIIDGMNRDAANADQIKELRRQIASITYRNP